MKGSALDATCAGLLAHHRDRAERALVERQLARRIQSTPSTQSIALHWTPDDARPVVAGDRAQQVAEPIWLIGDVSEVSGR